jgi:DNA-binding CsgD family transcriptional regulator
MGQNVRVLKSYTANNSTFASKFSRLIHTCEHSRNLMISIYHIDNDQFLYINKKFQDVLGSHYKTLVQKGWQFWFSIIGKKKLLKIKHKLSFFLEHPIDQSNISLCYTVIDAKGKPLLLRHEISLHKIENQTIAISYFFDISEKERIEQCLDVDSPKIIGTQATVPILISSRETEVLMLIADGFSSKQIAQKLFISNHTAISHRKHLIEKFKVKNTAQLIKEASKVIEL